MILRRVIVFVFTGARLVMVVSVFGAESRDGVDPAWPRTDFDRQPGPIRWLRVEHESSRDQRAEQHANQHRRKEFVSGFSSA